MLIFSDLHIHNYSAYDENGSRLSNCISALFDIFEYAKKNKHCTILFCGDLFHAKHKIPAKVINATYNAFCEIEPKYKGIKLYYITGNHDFIENNTYEDRAESALEYLSDFSFFVCIDNKRVEVSKGVWVHGIPFYRYSADIYSALGDIEFQDDAYNIVLMHNYPDGMSNKFVTPDFEYECSNLMLADKVFIGHSHKREKVAGGMQVVGSPMQNNHLDSGEDKGFIVFDPKKQKTTIKYLNYPKFITTEALDPESEDYQREKEKVRNTEMTIPINGSAKEILTAFWEDKSDDEELLTVGLNLL